MPDGDLNLLLKIDDGANGANAALDAVRAKMTEVSAVVTAKLNELNATQNSMNFGGPGRTPLYQWQVNEGRVRQLMECIKEQNRQALASYHAFGLGVRQTFDSVSQSLEIFGQKHTQVYRMVGATINQAIEAERRQAEQSGIAAMSGAQKTIGALKQLAPVKAAEDLAKGLEALAGFNLWSAAQCFAAAAMWGVVGASQIMGMVSSFGGGGRGERGSRGSGSSPGSGGVRGSSNDEWTYGAESTVGQTLATGAQGGSQSGQLTVAIMGDNQAGQWLATTLNQAVTQNGVSLVSTTSQRGAPVGH
jgi:hypothetical protein